MSRAEELGIKTVAESGWDKYCKRMNIKDKAGELSRLQNLYHIQDVNELMDRVNQDLL